MTPTDRQLAERTRAGDPHTRHMLIERYLPLARTLALRYRDSVEPLDDLIQVASVGLIKAVDRWEPERGFVFSSYAVPTILGELRRYFRDSTWMVRPPRELLELSLTIERSRASLQARTGREPSVEDFAAHLGRDPERVAAALHAAGGRSAFSLESEVHADGESGTVGERLGDEDREYEHVEARATFDSHVSQLDHRAREVLRLRFDDDLLQTQIADRLGCSQISVSRIIRASIESLAVPA
jgi:RNA polymerase sigma-B factor